MTTACRVIAALLLIVVAMGAGAQTPLSPETGELTDSASAERFAALRQHMVRTQIEERGIRDPRVLEAILRVPRHRFVPEEFVDFAYFDSPLPIEAGQTISQPYIVALMTSLLALEQSDRVLEVGTGSGYQAAILAELVDSVYTIEIVDTLAVTAARLLDDLGYDNVIVRSGDGFRGWPEAAPFDAIIVTCAPAEVPQPLKDQLAVGGKLVIPVGEDSQELLLIENAGDSLVTRTEALVRFVPMTGEAEQPSER
jgi:protein-L-isoaspartate(D-aspartate) O-methyltransferase